ncbi:protein kinase superfamily protein [Actinidia rufa]|uniref:Protein kinase superfamily protein n=1 Tax=Actinidia rufa TaxID=165716 RepID=A0A7J0H3Y6_9ERIC|nr:protein kinase superfamily protein [Actinidia rufa]
MDRLILNVRLLLLACFHLHRSRPGTLSFVRHFSYSDIKRATDGFRRIIDNSSLGVAYKAKFRDGHVALVKEVRDFDVENGAFYKEVQLLGRLHHRHIVSLNGFSTGRKRFLVFENIENGSLKDHLNDPLKTPLNWRTRLQIVIGVAAALEYLHFFCDPPMYHVSVSSSTILLDENFNAKLCDIGILGSHGNHITLPESLRSNECSSPICGNIIFQLGLLILEIVTGQCSEEGGVDIIQWVQESRYSQSIHKMLDPDLGNNFDSRELKGLLAVARLCIKSVDKPPLFTPQVFRYLQKKVGIA